MKTLSTFSSGFAEDFEQVCWEFPKETWQEIAVAFQASYDWIVDQTLKNLNHKAECWHHPLEV